MAVALAHIKYLQDLLIDHSGHIITDEQSYLFETRLDPMIRAHGVTTLEQLVYKMRISGDRQMLEHVVEAMTINETFFFRDVHPFDTLRNTIIPELIEKRKKERKLTIWSAACSSGQEPYSIAMIIREHFPELRNWNVKIIATDISQKVINKAISGTFTQFEVNRGLPAELLIQYFDRDGRDWIVRNNLRDLVEFEKLNLTKYWLTRARYDVIFLRNVLIYFGVETKTDILGRVRRNIKDDGHLFLGCGESMIGIEAPFKRAQVDKSVCFQPVI